MKRDNTTTASTDAPTGIMASFDTSKFKIINDYVMPIGGATNASVANPGLVKI